MIACFHRASALALVTASLLVAAPAWADDPPGEVPAAPAIQQTPYNTPPIAPPTVRKVDASEPRKITGMVLTFIGAFHGFAGTVVLGTFASSGGGDGFGLAIGLVIGGPMMGEGLILSSIGIPLWVSGARTVEQVDVPLAGSEFVPSVDVGAGTATATWHF